MESPSAKRLRLEDSCESGGQEESGMAAGALKKKVVLALCGSFSPITNLHMRMFELARDCLHRSGKYIVESGFISPVHDAYGKKGLVPGHHRLAMCRLAVKNSDWISVDSWEMEQETWTLTSPALKYFQERLSQEPGNQARIKLLCGADLLESFATPNLWSDEDIKTIVGEYGIVVISRAGSDPEKFIYESDQLYPLRNNIHICTEWIPNDVSSTKIRRSLKRGESVKYLIPDDVIDYIKQHNLYQN